MIDRHDISAEFSADEHIVVAESDTLEALKKLPASSFNECMLFVRANEDDNNHYLQTLKNSGIWGVYCGNEAYAKIHEYSGFNLAQWIAENISWSEDLTRETHTYFEENDLTKYLTW